MVSAETGQPYRTLPTAFAYLNRSSGEKPSCGCDLAGTDVHSLAPRRDAVIVIGSEGRGLSAAVRACVTDFVTIPRLGRAESLNAAVAAAIVCDNLRRLAGDR